VHAPDVPPPVIQHAQLLQLQRLVGNQRVLAALEGANQGSVGQGVAVPDVQRGKQTKRTRNSKVTVKKTVTRRGSPTGKGATQGQQLRAKGPTPAVGNPYARPRLTWGSSSGVGRRSGRTKQVVKVSGRSGTRSQTR